MTAWPRIAALLWSLAAAAGSAWADGSPEAEPWTLADLDKVGAAAAEAAPLARYDALRINDLLKLADALAGAGDAPAAYAALMVAASTPKNDRRPIFLQVQLVEKLVRLDHLDDATRVAQAAPDPQSAQELMAAIQKTRDGQRASASPPKATVPPEPNEDDLAAARDFLKAGKMEEARAAALRASQAALATANSPDLSKAQHFDELSQLSSIFGVLCQVGAYDQALATIQPVDSVNRRQYYFFAIEAAVRAHDDAAVYGLVPRAVAAFKVPAVDWGTVQNLDRTLRSLAVGGYRDAAHAVYAEFTTAYDGLTASKRLPPNPGMIAEAQALTGDLPAALNTADTLGPVAGPPSKGVIGMAAIFSFAEAKTPPTPEEIKSRLAQVQAEMPAQVAGPKANTLSDIAADLAGMHEIDAAISVEAALEGEPRDVLTAPRDRALTAISEAQEEAGDDEASLATALRITARELRFRRLLKLAAVPLH